jgi:hypothetical protein
MWHPLWRLRNALYPNPLDNIIAWFMAPQSPTRSFCGLSEPVARSWIQAGWATLQDTEQCVGVSEFARLRRERAFREEYEHKVWRLEYCVRYGKRKRILVVLRLDEIKVKDESGVQAVT